MEIHTHTHSSSIDILVAVSECDFSALEPREVNTDKRVSDFTTRGVAFKKVEDAWN